MVKYEIYKPLNHLGLRLLRGLSKNWYKFVLVSLALYLIFNKEISVQFAVNNKDDTVVSQGMDLVSQVAPQSTTAKVIPTSLVIAPKESQVAEEKTEKATTWKPAKKYSNLGFVLNPGFAEKHRVDPAVVEHHNNVCKSYLKRFAKVAIAEQRKFGVPASITLAQGLLESDAGESKLAVQSNNHFGIKCRSKCKGCTCRNYEDDSVYDMFRVFDSAWESYREHSKLMTDGRYKHLLKLNPTDYEAWAHGLKKAGYATDKRYAYKLIQIIEALQLYRFDRLAMQK